MNCPRCDKVLTDVCERCQGVWLDGGELAAIQQMGFVATLVDAFRFIRKM